MPRRLPACLALLAFSVTAWSGPTADAAPPAARDVTVTDITPRSFSVVWTTDEPATAGLRVFRGPACTDQVAEATITPHPTISGDPAVRAAAELGGVMKVRVSNLAPGTEYCYQTLTTAKSSQEVALAPPSPAPVRTARLVTRGIRPQPGDPLQPFSNDLVRFPVLLPDRSAAADGALIVVSAPRASAPLSAFVGDGVPLPHALVDLNNLFGADTGESLDLAGAERLVIRQLRGLRGATLVRFRELPAEEGLAELKDPLACFFADLDCSGTVNIVDLQRQLNQFGARTGEPGFNPDLDPDASGVVDQADTDLILGRFGQEKPFAP